MNSVRLLADKNIPLPPELLPDELSLSLFNPTGGIPADATDYDALFVRTVSPVGPSTLPDNPGRLKFVGSATAGIDHIDLEWLADRGIGFGHSPGSNARAVGEYVGISLLAWTVKTGLDPRSLTAGVIGAGHTGSEAGRILKNLGFQVLDHDPPREAREPAFSGAGLEDILQCDVLTFHTPFEQRGPHPTRHWLNRDKLSSGSFRMIVNAARGGIIDDRALYEARIHGSVGDYILDAWENEPLFDDRVAANAWLKTPHIAGYSLQAKYRASMMVIDRLCSFFGISYPDGQKKLARLSSPFPGPDLQPGLLRMLDLLNPFREYSRRFESLVGMDPSDKSRAFQNLRAGFPLRQEHAFYRLKPEITETYPVLSALGFRSEQTGGILRGNTSHLL